MAVDFKADDKKEFGRYFDEGVHKVTIKKVEQGTSDSGKEFFDFTVAGENGEEGNAKLWWTENANQRSFNTVRTMIIHNTVQANRDAARKMVDSANNTDDLFKLAKALVGKEAWYKVEKTDQTYTNANGELKHSYNRNIYGYEPKEKKPTASDLIAGLEAEGTPVDTDDIPFN